ncbi:MAG: DUF563 domain-containing protein [Alphaproteobacteria bacterium]|nr:DUF563 domain-containing protein [Alphaproteobacteria bacterium]
MKVSATSEADARIARGRHLARSHRYKEAFDELWRAVALRPEDSAAHRELGRALQLAQLWLDAIGPLRRAIELGDDDLELHFQLVLSLLDTDRTEEALALLNRLASVRPASPQVHAHRATALLDSGNPTAALSALRQAASLDRARFGGFEQVDVAELVSGPVGDIARHSAAHGQEPKSPGPGAYAAYPVPDARILGDYFLVMARDGTLFSDGLTFNPESMQDRALAYDHVSLFIGRRRYMAKTGPERRIAGAHLLIGGHQNFGHWLMNCVARLAYVEMIPELASLPVVVPYGLSETRSELLTLAGYGPDRRTEIDPSGVTRLELLWTPITLYRVQRQPRRLMLHTACGRYLNRLARRVCPRRPTPARRIYLQRPPGGHRRLLNERQLLDALAGFGVEALDPMTLSMRDQIELARQAELIIGVMGAGLNLAFFADRGTKVIQLAPSDVPLNSLPMICRQLEQSLSEIVCDRVAARDNLLYDDLVAPVEQVAAVVANALSPARDAQS